ncbi:2'-5'-oligoadenylate synthase 1A-like [Microtus ochrogaster]|uniref:2'-5'-oligoadenylate synthase 1A-like n=1 Tax=Microtus ochrogaster TaxID=79684 RepID=A0ABM0KE32_MICOH|nr:2'-5'-oligoadenylate synthase 1A-like [Microtus ochrogaster]
MERRLSSTPATELDKFIKNHLMPNPTFRTKVKAAINAISTFLIKNCFSDANQGEKVSKVVKGGSSGTDTELKGRSDAELVVFVKNLTSFEDQVKRWGEFIKEIEKQLRKLQHNKEFELKFEIKSEKWPDSLALNFKLSSPELQQEVVFDVLLADDFLDGVSTDGRPKPDIYKSLIQKCTSLGLEGEFSTCFSELQRNFVKDRPPKLKNLIRLVKHWYQLCKEKLRKPLPPQYALELLTVYAWEQGSGVTEFNTAQGFRTVLELVTKYRQLRIYWTKYYDFQDQDIANWLHRQLTRASPVILDPADPTRNVAGSNPVGWWLLAVEAVAWLDYSCVKNREKSQGCSWAVSPQVPVPPQQVNENQNLCLL